MTAVLLGHNNPYPRNTKAVPYTYPTSIETLFYSSKVTSTHMCPGIIIAPSIICTTPGDHHEGSRYALSQMTRYLMYRLS